MRIALRLLTAAALMAACLVQPICCASLAWLSDSFDSYAAGNLAGQGGWTGSSVVKVQSAFAKSGKAIEADRLIHGPGDVTRPVVSGMGYHFIDFDAAIDMEGTAGIGSNIGYIRFLNTAGNEITRFYFAFRQFKVLLGPANQHVVLDNVENRRWYHIRFGIDLSAGKMDVWVDGVQKVVGGSIYQAASSIDRVVIGQWSQQVAVTKNMMYVDSLYCINSENTIPTKILSPKFFPGWQAHNVCYPFVIEDPDTGGYRMYYSGTGTCQINDSVWDQWTTGMVTSPDSLNWKLPDNYEATLNAWKFYEGDVVDPEECSAVFDSICAMGPCVVRDGSGYKMWYTGWNGDLEELSGGLVNKINYRIGYATSPDGITWTKVQGTAGAGSVLGLGAPGELDACGVAHPHVIKEESLYRMWYEGYDGSTWRIFYATSTDGINWTRQGLAIDVGANGAPDAVSVRNPVVIMRNGQYELWYQGRGTTAPHHHILRATSPDGITWTKVQGQVTLRPPDDTLDNDESILVDSIIVRSGGACQVFYAKQNTKIEPVANGSVKLRFYHIYTEVVNP